ncbi:hypothetical protein [Scytonema sp. NUACC26]|uniref:hypothetical protein n=1 Tax=Scytonema sp. NUACC26 TaxID=3140176 RepID=UPI0038B3B622
MLGFHLPDTQLVCVFQDSADNAIACQSDSVHKTLMSDRSTDAVIKITIFM